MTVNGLLAKGKSKTLNEGVLSISLPSSNVISYGL